MNDVIKHHGIIGMKWGIRRYQNKDGSLTPLGKRREAKLDAKMNEYARKYKMTKARKLIKDKPSNKEEQDNLYKRKNSKLMSDTELKEKTNRLILENNYNTAMNIYEQQHPKRISKGKAFINTVRDDVLVPAAKDIAKKQVKDFANKVISNAVNKKKE